MSKMARATKAFLAFQLVYYGLAFIEFLFNYDFYTTDHGLPFSFDQKVVDAIVHFQWSAVMVGIVVGLILGAIYYGDYPRKPRVRW